MSDWSSDVCSSDLTAEEMLIGAYELISKVYSQEAVIRAYQRTDPDTMDIRTD